MYGVPVFMTIQFLLHVKVLASSLSLLVMSFETMGSLIAAVRTQYTTGS